MHTGAFAGAPVVADSHHHGLAQGLVEFLGSSLPKGHVVGILQLCLGPLNNVQAIDIHSSILHSITGLSSIRRVAPADKKQPLPHEKPLRASSHTEYAMRVIQFCPFVKKNRHLDEKFSILGEKDALFCEKLYIFMRRRRASGTLYGKAGSPRQSLRPQKRHPPHKKPPIPVGTSGFFIFSTCFWRSAPAWGISPAVLPACR